MQMKRHQFSDLVNNLRDIPDIQSKRKLIIRVLGVYGIFPEPVNLGVKSLLRVTRVESGMAYVTGASAELKVPCNFTTVAAGWYYDGSFISPEQFAAMDPGTYHV